MWLQFQILWTNIKLLSFQKVLNNLFYFYDTSYSKYKAYCLFHFIPVPSPTPHRAPFSYFYTRNRAVTIIIDCHCSLNFAFFSHFVRDYTGSYRGEGGRPPPFCWKSKTIITHTAVNWPSDFTPRYLFL